MFVTRIAPARTSHPPVQHFPAMVWQVSCPHCPKKKFSGPTQEEARGRLHQHASSTACFTTKEDPDRVHHD